MSPAPLSEIVTFLRAQVLSRIKLPESELGNDMVLSDLGVDSLDVVLISGKVEDQFEIEVNPAMMFEYRTINAVAQRILEIMQEA